MTSDNSVSEDSFSEVREFARFIAPLQQDPTSHMMMVGTEEAGIVKELEEFETKLFFERADDGTILGVAGLDYDEPLNRAYIYGPWALPDRWDEVAGRLFERVISAAPPQMKDMDTAFNKENSAAEDLAVERGFQLVRDHFTMAIEPDDRDLAPDPEIREVTDTDRARVIEIHERCFENVWPNGEQMFEQLQKGPDRKLFVLELDGEIAGYHYAGVDRELGEAFIDNIGVDERFRGRGAATRLLSHGLAWMFGFAEMTRIELAVREENRAALKVYEKAGFERIHAIRQMRLPAERRP